MGRTDFQASLSHLTISPWWQTSSLPNFSQAVPSMDPCVQTHNAATQEMHVGVQCSRLSHSTAVTLSGVMQCCSRQQATSWDNIYLFIVSIYYCDAALWDLNPCKSFKCNKYQLISASTNKY